MRYLRMIKQELNEMRQNYEERCIADGTMNDEDLAVIRTLVAAISVVDAVTEVKKLKEGNFK